MADLVFGCLFGNAFLREAFILQRDVEIHPLGLRWRVFLIQSDATSHIPLSSFTFIFKEIRKDLIFLSKCNLFDLLTILFSGHGFWRNFYLALLNSLDEMLGLGFSYFPCQNFCLLLDFVGLVADVVIFEDDGVEL